MGLSPADAGAQVDEYGTAVSSDIYNPVSITVDNNNAAPRVLRISWGEALTDESTLDPALDSYQLQVATDANFTTVVEDVVKRSRSHKYHIPKTSESTGHYARVRTLDEAGNAGSQYMKGWTSATSPGTKTAAAWTATTSPVTGVAAEMGGGAATVAPATPVIRVKRLHKALRVMWQDCAPTDAQEPEKYRVYVSTDGDPWPSTGGPLVKPVEKTRTTSVTVDSYSPTLGTVAAPSAAQSDIVYKDDKGKSFYIRVAAVNAAGTTVSNLLSAVSLKRRMTSTPSRSDGGDLDFDDLYVQRIVVDAAGGERATDMIELADLDQDFYDWDVSTSATRSSRAYATWWSPGSGATPGVTLNGTALIASRGKIIVKGMNHAGAMDFRGCCIYIPGDLGGTQSFGVSKDHLTEADGTKRHALYVVGPSGTWYFWTQRNIGATG